MDNDLDIRDLILEVTADIQEIVREVLEELAAPHMKRQALMAWAQASDQVKEQTAASNPELFRDIMKERGRR